jgi:hypothetical protein
MVLYRELYDSRLVWSDLAETGKCRLNCYDGLELELLRERLHEEAGEEGVQLRINAVRIPHLNDVYLVHVFLRKQR